MKKGGILILTAAVCAFASCRKVESEYSGQPVVEACGETLFLSEIEDFMPENISPEDSAKYADSYVKKWTLRTLMFDKAENNITDDQAREIEQLVDDYRRMLVIQAYQQRLADRRVKLPTEEEEREFFEKHSDMFRLKDDMVQGVFMEVPCNTPKLDKLRRDFQRFPDNVSEIEKYGYQNALTYEYFMDTWLESRRLRELFSANFSLKKGLQEYSDDKSVRLLYLSDWRRGGDVMPFDVARHEVQQVLKNRKTVDFLRKFEEDLYNNAVKSGKVTRFDKKDKQ